MTIADSARNATKLLRKHAPDAFTGLSVAGVVTTAYLTGRASWKAALVIQEEERINGTADDPKERLKGRSKLVWKLYIPPAVSGMATVGCIFGLSRVTARRATAAATAYAVAERGFEEYKEKVAEQLGNNKEQRIRDSIAQDKVDANPPTKEILITDTGVVLICELYTGRYFPSTKEAVNRAEIEINNRILSDRYTMLSEFYDILYLAQTSQSDFLGWEDKELKLRWTATEHHGVPCLAFDYNYVKPLA